MDSYLAERVLLHLMLPLEARRCVPCFRNELLGTMKGERREAHTAFRRRREEHRKPVKEAEEQAESIHAESIQFRHKRIYRGTRFIS
jgi:hypothetical protein